MLFNQYRYWGCRRASVLARPRRPAAAADPTPTLCAREVLARDPTCHPHAPAAVLAAVLACNSQHCTDQSGSAATAASVLPFAAVLIQRHHRRSDPSTSDGVTMRILNRETMLGPYRHHSSQSPDSRLAASDRRGGLRFWNHRTRGCSTRNDQHARCVNRHAGRPPALSTHAAHNQRTGPGSRTCPCLPHRAFGCEPIAQQRTAHRPPGAVRSCCRRPTPTTSATSSRPPTAPCGTDSDAIDNDDPLACAGRRRMRLDHRHGHRPTSPTTTATSKPLIRCLLPGLLAFGEITGCRTTRRPRRPR